MDATSAHAAMRLLERRYYRKGEVIFRQDEPGDRAFLVQEGSVEILRDDKLLGVVTAGGMFGEMALIDREPRMASAHAAEDTACLVIPEDMFRAKLKDADPFIVGLLRILLTTARATSEKLAQTWRGLG
ncbi:MAG: putative cAMP-binding protein-catabolite activator and regulatory subunit of cAMP-dependent [Rhodospirillales bacterium]|jgi:CRP/FNR family cyclic AMP-dependent transcriptional regulator|nr:putative cAMP-binding protein-catabolite activator and regulatory subunit of cAMP-dependent [Rhodospirillales bacterium]